MSSFSVTDKNPRLIAGGSSFSIALRLSTENHIHIKANNRALPSPNQ